MIPIQEHVKRMIQETHDEFNNKLKEYFEFADGLGESNNADAGKTFEEEDLKAINNKRFCTVLYTYYFLGQHFYPQHHFTLAYQRYNFYQCPVGTI